MKPDSEKVSTVLVPRFETPSTLALAPPRKASISAASSWAAGAQAFSPSVNRVNFLPPTDALTSVPFLNG